MQAVRGEYKGTGHPPEESGSGSCTNQVRILLLIVIFLIMSSLRRKVKRGCGYAGWGGPYIGGFGGNGGGGGGGSSSGGGGFSGFSGGGGSFGGGGAGSSW
jgi:uncharacterized protein